MTERVLLSGEALMLVVALDNACDVYDWLLTVEELCAVGSGLFVTLFHRACLKARQENPTADLRALVVMTLAVMVEKVCEDVRALDARSRDIV
jgi:hypothetical protein